LAFCEEKARILSCPRFLIDYYIVRTDEIAQIKLNNFSILIRQIVLEVAE